MVDAFTPETFTSYFFGNFACIMVDITSGDTQFWTQDHPPKFWSTVILGCFYVFATPNIPPFPADRRSNLTILDDVHTCAMLGISHLLRIIEKLHPLIVCLAF